MVIDCHRQNTLPFPFSRRYSSLSRLGPRNRPARRPRRYALFITKVELDALVGIRRIAKMRANYFFKCCLGIHNSGVVFVPFDAFLVFEFSWVTGEPEFFSDLFL